MTNFPCNCHENKRTSEADNKLTESRVSIICTTVLILRIGIIYESCIIIINMSFEVDSA